MTTIQETIDKSAGPHLKKLLKTMATPILVYREQEIDEMGEKLNMEEKIQALEEATNEELGEAYKDALASDQPITTQTRVVHSTSHVASFYFLNRISSEIESEINELSEALDGLENEMDRDPIDQARRNLLDLLEGLSFRTIQMEAEITTITRSLLSAEKQRAKIEEIRTYLRG